MIKFHASPAALALGVPDADGRTDSLSVAAAAYILFPLFVVLLLLFPLRGLTVQSEAQVEEQPSFYKVRQLLEVQSC